MFMRKKSHSAKKPRNNGRKAKRANSVCLDCTAHQEDNSLFNSDDGGSAVSHESTKRKINADFDKD